MPSVIQVPVRAMFLYTSEMLHFKFAPLQKRFASNLIHFKNALLPIRAAWNILFFTVRHHILLYNHKLASSKDMRSMLCSMTCPYHLV